MEKMDQLRRIRGVGEVLATRLRAAGLDSFRAVAEGGEGALRGIPGINQRLVPGMVQQAQELAREDRDAAEGEAPRELAPRVGALRDALQHLARESRERFAGKISGKTGRRLAEEMVRIADALDRLAETDRHRKRTHKGLAKAERRLERLRQAGLKKFCKGIKKSRKTLAELAR